MDGDLEGKRGGPAAGLRKVEDRGEGAGRSNGERRMRRRQAEVQTGSRKGGLFRPNRGCWNGRCAAVIGADALQAGTAGILEQHGAMMLAEAAATGWKAGGVIGKDRGRDRRKAENREQQNCPGSAHVGILHDFCRIIQK